MKLKFIAPSIAGLSFFAAASVTAQECPSSKKSAWSNNTSCSAASYASKSKDIVDTAVGTGSFDTLVTAVKAAGLVETLKGEGPFTVFAPSDDAFGKLPEGTISKLLKPENKQMLADILTYHVVPGRVLAKQVVDLSNAGTANGQRLNIMVEDGKVFINDSKVVTTDIECSNGVIHVIDSVLLPNNKNIVEVAAGNESFATLVKAVKAADLVDVLSGDGPFTVFAPTDAAFAKLPEGTLANLLKPENQDQLIEVLKYHVVAGRIYSDQALKAKEAKTLAGIKIEIQMQDGKAWVNSSGLIKTDLDTSNGVIHVIDAVLIPPHGA